VFAQGAAGPVMLVGCAGMTDGVTAIVRAVDVPQLFVPVTEMVPLPDPAVTVMLFEVDVPVQPVGRLQM
jgi:hypothetical protein